jgi:hypothetical protein
MMSGSRGGPPRRRGVDPDAHRHRVVRELGRDRFFEELIVFAFVAQGIVR